MSELMLINPRRKRRSGRRKMSALQRSYFGKRRVTRLASNPKRRRRRSRVAALSAAPVAVRRSRRRGRARSYVSRARRRFSSNLSAGSLKNTLMNASIGAGGALALDFAWPYLPIPASLQTGMLAPIVRLAGAVGIGFVAGKILGKRAGVEAMAGAVTVTLYDLAKSYMAGAAAPVTDPTSGTSAYVGQMGYYGAAPQFTDGMGAFVR